MIATGRDVLRSLLRAVEVDMERCGQKPAVLSPAPGIPVDRAMVCANCDQVVVTRGTCPSCQSNQVTPLAAWLSARKGPLRSQCAWCFPTGSPGHDPLASHGICDHHADELRARHGLRRVG